MSPAISRFATDVTSHVFHCIPVFGEFWRILENDEFLYVSVRLLFLMAHQSLPFWCAPSSSGTWLTWQRSDCKWRKLCESQTRSDLPQAFGTVMRWNAVEMLVEMLFAHVCPWSWSPRHLLWNPRRRQSWPQHETISKQRRTVHAQRYYCY